MNDLHLTHAELLNPKCKHEPILLPWAIPVHRDVFEHDSVYSPEFVAKVKAAVPEYIQRDIETITSVLGKNPEVRVDETGLRDTKTGSFYRHDSFGTIVDPKSVSVHLGHKCIALYRKLFTVLNTNGHPMNEERLREYAFETEPYLGVYNWADNDVEDYALLGTLYMRNFAIAFNNLGLDLVAEK